MEGWMIGDVDGNIKVGEKGEEGWTDRERRKRVHVMSDSDEQR